MKLSTMRSLVRGGSLFLLLRCRSLFRGFYRILFLASIADTTLLRLFARETVTAEGQKERVGLLEHLRVLLRPGGRIVLSTGCQGGGIEFELVNLIHAATRGWGRIPGREEMVRQLADAGFERVRSMSLVPGDNYCSFIGRRPE
ncbi:MAG: hypothetical protein JXA20_14020 [Spirochaetes bacterium]|nr:hypothetical protein [Spirochaetota bacterium]